MSDHDDPIARALRPQVEQSRERRSFGLATAKVERAEGDGTYRLRIFGMNAQDGDDTSAPARMATPSAGGGRGLHFMPEPGDEVVCGFSGGDTNHPIILGALWNHDDQPPSQAQHSAQNNVRTIVSRSGHEITLDDTGGAERVLVRSHSGHSLTLDDGPAPRVTLETQGGHKVTLDDGPVPRILIQTSTGQSLLMDAVAGTVTVLSPTAINLVSGGTTFSVAGGAGGALEMNSDTNIKLKARKIELESTAEPVSIKSGVGETKIDGKSFMGHTHRVTGVNAETNPAKGSP